MHGTHDPLLIMLINMTIVFAVLFVLSLIIRLLKVINDAIYEKKGKTDIPSPVSIRRPSAVPSASLPQEKKLNMEDKTLLAVITTAIMAYGYKDVKIRSIVKKS
ncbi:OadG family protein [Pectinatus sottacetonis]|uniref:OadG family protein n=1 Tax=Pectinatus sottacetonis TaxID=1002795 RepID=UPI0018C51304|nr:OadG family protein [Pectinatus sottacetonis]